MTTTALQTNGLQKLKAILNNETMQQNFRNILSDNAGAFMASIIELYQSDSQLQECDPNRVILEALKAATLKLPINKQLGLSYIVPFKSGGMPVPTFIIGYRGYIQLAMRTGQYKAINAGCVYEGEQVILDRVKGSMTITGSSSGDNAVGYFAYFSLLNGFEKSIYWSRARVLEHAQTRSKSWKRDNSPWHTDFDAMAIKTLIRNLISKWGVTSIEFAGQITQDTDEDDALDAAVNADANGKPLRIPNPDTEPVSDQEPGPAATDEGEAPVHADGDDVPDFMR